MRTNNYQDAVNINVGAILFGIMVGVILTLACVTIGIDRGWYSDLSAWWGRCF